MQIAPGIAAVVPDFDQGEGLGDQGILHAEADGAVAAQGVVRLDHGVCLIVARGVQISGVIGLDLRLRHPVFVGVVVGVEFGQGRVGMAPGIAPDGGLAAAVGPAVLRRGPCRAVVRHGPPLQLHVDLAGAQGVDVGGVVPGLADGDQRFRQGVGDGDGLEGVVVVGAFGHQGLGRGIAVLSFRRRAAAVVDALGDGVGDGVAVLVIERHVLKNHGPGLRVRCQRFRLGVADARRVAAVGQGEVDVVVQRVGAQAAVVPDLGHRDRTLLQRVRHGDPVVGPVRQRRRSGIAHLVARRHLLRHGVDDRIGLSVEGRRAVGVDGAREVLKQLDPIL